MILPVTRGEFLEIMPPESWRWLSHSRDIITRDSWVLPVNPWMSSGLMMIILSLFTIHADRIKGVYLLSMEPELKITEQNFRKIQAGNGYFLFCLSLLHSLLFLSAYHRWLKLKGVQLKLCTPILSMFKSNEMA